MKVDEIYHVKHRRKGSFLLQLIHIGEVWITGVIIDGKAGAILNYNERYVGEQITIRKEFCTFKRASKGGKQ